MVRNHFYHLFHTANPPYKIVKHFARLLNFNLEDYHRELELQVSFLYYIIIDCKYQCLSHFISSMHKREIIEKGYFSKCNIGNQIILKSI